MDVGLKLEQVQKSGNENAYNNDEHKVFAVIIKIERKRRF